MEVQVIVASVRLSCTVMAFSSTSREFWSHPVIATFASVSTPPSQGSQQTAMDRPSYHYWSSNTSDHQSVAGKPRGPKQIGKCTAKVTHKSLKVACSCRPLAFQVSYFGCSKQLQSHWDPMYILHRPQRSVRRLERKGSICLIPSAIIADLCATPPFLELAVNGSVFCR